MFDKVSSDDINLLFISVYLISGLKDLFIESQDHSVLPIKQIEVWTPFLVDYDSSYISG